MKSKHYIIRILAFITLAASLICLLAAPVSADGKSLVNRYNVVMVLDNSNSMYDTDAEGLRYEAISQFTSLLTEKGNYLGAVLFSNDVLADKAPIPVNSWSDKTQVTDILKSAQPKGYTNIGQALSRAVDMLNSYGNAELPSVIVLLSDGNTEMPSTSELQNSLRMKADALESARQSNVSIYSICLNADGSADTSEMEQISSATGGMFREVKSAKDLSDVLLTFYNLIYGTGTVTILDSDFPASGILEAEFDVPRIGVEEVNIVIDTATDSVSLFSPDGSRSDAFTVSSRHFTVMKLSSIIPGSWRLVAEGEAGSHIKVNMVYNTNLGVAVETDPNKTEFKHNADITVRAVLTEDGEICTDDYTGYSATLHVLDAYENEVDSLPMETKGSRFETECKLDDGTYYLNVSVEGSYLTKVSDNLGPITVGKAGSSQGNTAPEPIHKTVKRTVFIWPFTEAKGLTIDMSGLAKDAEDDVLSYKIVSSSFIEGSDYTVEEDVISITGYSLCKGSFDIKATDTGGLSCSINLIVRCIHIGLLAAAAILLGALGVLIAMFILSRKPFRGAVTVYSESGGIRNGTTLRRKSGRIKLSAFGIDNLGLDLSRCYVQATGKPCVILKLSKKVTYRGEKTAKITVQSGYDAAISADTAKTDERLHVHFESDFPAGGQHTRPRFGGFGGFGGRRIRSRAGNRGYGGGHFR